MHRLLMRYRHTAMRPCLSPESAVFPRRAPKVLTRSLARLVSDLKLKNLRFHDLRHDAASSLTMAGVSQRTIMEILGHRDPRMTMRYQHLSPAHLRDAMTALDQAMRSAAEENPKAGEGGTTTGFRSGCVPTGTA